MARRVKHHMEHLEKHSGGREQAIAIAASECGISKNKSESVTKELCYESQVPVGSFSASHIDSQPIKINGGNYKWTDTGDGYFTVHDIPLVCEAPEGTKGAPYAVTKSKLSEFLNNAQLWYRNGNFCARAFKRHNGSNPVIPPSMLGYVLPNRIGKYQWPDKSEKWTLYGDVKLDKGAFESARSGKLPCLSVEIPWSENRISGLAFLDTEDPFYKFSLFTLSANGRVDETAKFRSQEIPMNDEEKKSFIEQLSEKEKEIETLNGKIAKFEGGGTAGGDGGDSGGSGDSGDSGDSGGETSDGGEGEFKRKYSGLYARISKMESGLGSLMKHLGISTMVDDMDRKPNPLPVEPKGDEDKKEGKMQMDPESAAKFASMANDVAEMKAKIAAQEAEKTSAAFVAKAEQALSGKVVPSVMSQQIASFASDAVKREKGAEWFDKFIESLKPSLRDKPAILSARFDMAMGTPVVGDSSDPVLAKFVNESTEAQAEVSRFAMQYNAMIRKSNGMTCPKEEFIKNELSLWKAKRSEALNQSGERG